MSGQLNLIFKGTLQNSPYSVYTDIVVRSAGGNPPGFQTADIYNHFFDPQSFPIKWESGAAFLDGRSINDLLKTDVLKGAPFNVSQKFTFTIKSGVQNFGNGMNQIFLLEPQNQGGLLIPTPFQLTGVFSDGLPATTTYSNNPSFIFQQNIQNTTTNPITLGGIQSIGWTDQSVVSNQQINNSTLEMQMDVTVEVFCRDFDLESGFCFNYCILPPNQITCLDNLYKNYCFVETDSTTKEINVFSSSGCQNFLKDYIITNGPSSIIDTPLVTACSKFKGFTQLSQFPDINVRDLCACHLDEELYLNLYNSLIAQYPGFQFVDENERCLYPPCASSDYKTTANRTCPVANCINVASITNNGTVVGGNAITQDDRCANIAGQTGPNGGGGGGTPDKPKTSWFDQHWIWIVLGIAFLIVLIIIIVIIIIAERKKKK